MRWRSTASFSAESRNELANSEYLDDAELEQLVRKTNSATTASVRELDNGTIAFDTAVNPLGGAGWLKQVKSKAANDTTTGERKGAQGAAQGTGKAAKLVTGNATKTGGAARRNRMPVAVVGTAEGAADVCWASHWLNLRTASGHNKTIDQCLLRTPLSGGRLRPVAHLVSGRDGVAPTPC